MTYKDPETLEAPHWLLSPSTSALPHTWIIRRLPRFETHPEHQTELRLKSKASPSRTRLKLEALGFWADIQHTAKALSCARVNRPFHHVRLLSEFLYLFHMHECCPPFFQNFHGRQCGNKMPQISSREVHCGCRYLPSLPVISCLYRSLVQLQDGLRKELFLVSQLISDLKKLTLIVMFGVLVNSPLLAFSVVPMNWQKSSHIPPNPPGNISIIMHS